MKLALIDRDGVINVEVADGYLESIAELDIYPQALEAFALLKQNGFTCVVVTNQSVVARGRITLGDLHEIHNYLREKVAAAGGEIAEFYVCTDHPDKPTNRRKPGCGMLVEALEKYKAEPATTPMIGDAITDMHAAESAGCARYLVMTGKGKLTQTQLTEKLYPVTVSDDILDAARKIIAAYP